MYAWVFWNRGRQAIGFSDCIAIALLALFPKNCIALQLSFGNRVAIALHCSQFLAIALRLHCIAGNFIFSNFLMEFYFEFWGDLVTVTRMGSDLEAEKKPVNSW